jgi:hypothetical protein
MGAFRRWARRAHSVSSLYNKKSNLEGGEMSFTPSKNISEVEDNKSNFEIS